MSVKTKIKTISWSLLGLCCVVLLIAAAKAKDSKACKAVNIKIEGATQHVFIKNADVVAVLNQNNIHAGEALEFIDLRKTEAQLERNAWIKDAELFFDNLQTLHINVIEREPLARVFTVSGNSFYIDSSGLRLPVNENATARLIVFTSFPSDLPAGGHSKEILSKPDSLVLNDIKKLAQYIGTDSFLNEQTAQVNITQQRTYEITPVIGSQVIRIGNADSLDEKFTKLLAFYKQVFSKVGFEKYSVIDVQYEGQVVAVRRGESYTISDTAKAMMQLAKADTKLSTVLNDTTYSAPISKPVAIDNGNVSSKNTAGKTIAQRQTKANKKVNSNKKPEVRKPKAVMKKKG
jgi:cell division protein FtsQ